MAKREKNQRDVLPAGDVQVMVMQLADSARRLRDCGDIEGAVDAAATAALYAADARMDPRFHRAMDKLLQDLGVEEYRSPKFNNPQPGLKSKLLR